LGIEFQNNAPPSRFVLPPTMPSDITKPWEQIQILYG
jgi:hypothetical protein